MDVALFFPSVSHWMPGLLAVACGLALNAGAEPPPYPEGTIQKLKFAESRIFPGTVREVQVFVPAQYDGSRPACVYVRQDGYNPKEKAVLEQLIATGEIPVTIGVFVQPGNVPPPNKALMGRRNRCFEYDGVGDRFARFISGEILPFVARNCGVKLSESANDRCIAGASSGGISAFNAAWERPDLFSRVYANSGSFVAFRGGHELPTLVRKTEAQPIRAYLTTATHDMENCAGDWFLIDQEMDKALKFAGYDYVFHIVEGKHCAGWDDHFAEAMRFIWKEWPKPVQAGQSAPRARDVLVEGQGWEPVAAEVGTTSGPACNSKGEVFFVDTRANRILRLGLDGGVTVFAADAAHAGSVAVGANDELYSFSMTTGNVIRYAADGKDGKGTLYASGVKGRYGVAAPGGGLYVSCPEAAGGSRICFIKDGAVRWLESEAEGRALKGAAGLALRPDQWLLAVADGASKWAFSYQIQPDGSLANGERFFWLHVPDAEDDAGAESLIYAREGQLLAATRMGIQICADDGPSQVILPLPDRSRVTGVCLGGSDGSTLYAFCDGKIWKRAVKIHAAGAWSPVVKIERTPL